MNVVQSVTTSVVYEREKIVLVIDKYAMWVACGGSKSERSRISTAYPAPAEMVVKIESCQIEDADFEVPDSSSIRAPSHVFLLFGCPAVGRHSYWNKKRTGGTEMAFKIRSFQVIKRTIKKRGLRREISLLKHGRDIKGACCKSWCSRRGVWGGIRPLRIKWCSQSLHQMSWYLIGNLHYLGKRGLRIHPR